ncbi:MAG: RelA/SpoT family protein [Gammaproteobacteria bacterium]|nr:RelA/SpoT family protein [Gammaproteobacteria bacterium]
MKPSLSLKTSEWISQLESTSNIAVIKQARDFARTHQKENEGLAIAEILHGLQCDDSAIAAGIIYPSIAASPHLLEKLPDQFSKTIGKIISGALQMNIIHHVRSEQDEKNKVTGQQNQIDNLRKMMLSMVDDIRTILLKLAERLILLQNLKLSSPEIQKKTAQETVDYYAPLANRLGVGHLKWQLEDYAFRYLHPTDYHAISKSLHMRRTDRETVILNMISELKLLLEKNGLKNSKISGRAKHIYSIYRKIQKKQTCFEYIYDANAVRILVQTVTDCYTALSLVHEKWASISAEFDDYIAKPKPNGYQSIHTAILIQNMPIEIQIRTIDMHEKAELGIAAHWKYKESNSTQGKDEQKITLLRELLDWQKNTLGTEESQTELYKQAFGDRVYIFSPNGDVFDLQKGATPLDFAYLVHSEVGHRCRGAKINNNLVPLTYMLKTGDRIDILTIKESNPSRDWLRSSLGFLKTNHAKQKVKQWFRKQDYTKNLADGLLIWEKAYQQKGLQKSDINKMHEQFNLKNVDALLAALGTGDIKLAAILNKLAAIHRPKINSIIIEKDKIKNKTLGNDFSIHGTKHLLTQIAHCCHPIPGDIITGYITQGHGITVHQKYCRNILEMTHKRPERLIDISWENTSKKNYRVNLSIQSDDRHGLLHDISGLITQLDLSILAVQSHIHSENNTVTLELTLQITNLAMLDELLKKIRQVNGVIEVIRK